MRSTFMHDFFDALANVILDRSADELIGAVIVALGFSLAFTGLDFISRRKVRENRLPMIVAMIGANLASMAFAAGYIVYHRKARVASASERNQMISLRPEPILAESILRAADKNEDGRLSSEEAAVAAAEFVRRADPTGNGSIDASTLEHALPPGGFPRGRRPANNTSFRK
jgi:hypothetical protein